MRLGKTYRWRVSNTHNQAVTVTLTAMPWKMVNGVLVYGSATTILSAVSLAATTGTSVGSTQDNSADLYWGADLTLACTAAVAVSGVGSVAVQLEHSVDGGTTWATAGLGVPVGGYLITPADGTSLRRKDLSV